MSGPGALLITAGLLIASGFFVAAEFALVAARRHRLEQAVAGGKRGAKAALAGVRELSLMLAGAQLGITMVVVGLGMVSEPALHHYLEPPLTALGLPEASADVIALVIALAVITFLHVVVGEMAPKSWAIAHPEHSAMLLAPAFRAFTAVTRWLLVALNGFTNALLRLFRVTPRDEIVIVRNREQIHHLIDESSRLGLIDPDDHALLTRALDAPVRPVDQVMVPAAEIVDIAEDASAQHVVDAVARTGRTRLVVRHHDGEIVGSVHVRDALIARDHDQTWTAGARISPLPKVTAGTDVTTAAEQLRGAHTQLALVIDAQGSVIGLISMDDLVSTILIG